MSQAFARGGGYRKTFAFFFLSSLGFMSSLCRLQWLTSQIHMGRSAHVSFSHNASTQSEKIKFTLDNAYDLHGTCRPLLFGALLAAQHAIDCAVTTDKGHKSSNGLTVVEFWCKQPPLVRPGAASVIVVDEMTEVTPMPLPLSTRPSDGASLLASGITFDSVPDVADVADVAPCEHVADLARHAHLMVHFEICDRQDVENKKQVQVLAEDERRLGSEHPIVKSSRTRLHSVLRSNAVNRDEIVQKLIVINVRLEQYGG